MTPWEQQAKRDRVVLTFLVVFWAVGWLVVGLVHLAA
jgi:hypothetical protein